MPTTLFVLDQRGDQLVQAGRPALRPDQGRARQRQRPAALLHLRGGVQLLGHGLCRDADGGAAGDPDRAGDRLSSSISTGGSITDDRGAALRSAARLDVVGAWLLAIAWIAPLLYAFWTAFHPPAYATRFDLTRTGDAREFPVGLARGAVRALLPQHVHAGDDGAGRRSSCSARSRLMPSRASRFSGPRAWCSASCCCSS